MAARIRVRGEVSEIRTFDESYLVTVEDGRRFGAFVGKDSELGQVIAAGEVSESGSVLELAGRLQIRRSDGYVNTNVRVESFKVYRLEAVE
jgi:hypothetical protein